jgi:hypothetical protein
LSGLLGGEGKVDSTVNQHRDELQQMRTTTLKERPPLTGSAEFWVLLGAANHGVAVENVKYVSGEEKLRSLEEALRHLKFDVNFPDETPTKILRRGVLSCSQASGSCTFVLVLPDDVRSVN